MLLVAILVMQLTRCDPMVSRENFWAVVILVEAEGLGDKGLQSRVVVITPDSLKVRLILPPPVPVAGDLIPLVVEHYKKRDPWYFLDRQKWLMEGPR